MKKEFNLMFDGAIICAVILAAGCIVAAIGMILNLKYLGFAGLIALIAGFLFMSGLMVFCDSRK